jgi:isocitrate/isopropylmalate dehydrogenase
MKQTYELVLLPGDGIGPEVIAEARALVGAVGTATGAGFALDEIPCGGKFYLAHDGRDWPDGAAWVPRVGESAARSTPEWDALGPLLMR